LIVSLLAAKNRLKKQTISVELGVDKAIGAILPRRMCRMRSFGAKPGAVRVVFQPISCVANSPRHCDGAE